MMRPVTTPSITRSYADDNHHCDHLSPSSQNETSMRRGRCVAYVEMDAANVRADLEGRAVGRGVDHSPSRGEELAHRPAAACTHSERWLRTL